MNALAVAPAVDLSIEPSTLSVEARKLILERLEATIAEHLIYKGKVLASLAADGVKIAHDFHYLVLQKVGDGSVVPEVYIRFQHKPRLMHRLSMMPLASQRRLAADEPVEVVEMVGREPTTRLVPVIELDGDQVRQVFDGPRMRSPEEQGRWIKRKDSKRRDLSSDPRIVIGKGFVNIGGVRLRRKQLIELADRLAE